MRITYTSVLTFFLGLTVWTSAVAEIAKPVLPTAQEVRHLYEETAAKSADIPLILQHAIIAAEDRDFLKDAPTFSPITKTLGRNVVPGRARSIPRDLALGILVGNALTADEILKWYANLAYFGQGCYGVFDAANAFFGKPANALSISEAAYFAAVLKAPSQYHPITQYDRSVARRNFVISQMFEAGFISNADALAAQATKLIVQNPLKKCPYKP